MDPTENVKEQLELANAIVSDIDKFGESDGFDITDEAERLAELVIALDNWRNAGGYDPYNDLETGKPNA